MFLVESGSIIFPVHGLHKPSFIPAAAAAWLEQQQGLIDVLMYNQLQRIRHTSHAATARHGALQVNIIRIYTMLTEWRLLYCTRCIVLQMHCWGDISNTIPTLYYYNLLDACRPICRLTPSEHIRFILFSFSVFHFLVVIKTKLKRIQIKR